MAEVGSESWNTAGELQGKHDWHHSMLVFIHKCTCMYVREVKDKGIILLFILLSLILFNFTFISKQKLTFKSHLKSLLVNGTMHFCWAVQVCCSFVFVDISHFKAIQNLTWPAFDYISKWNSALHFYNVCLLVLKRLTMYGWRSICDLSKHFPI